MTYRRKFSRRSLLIGGGAACAASVLPFARRASADGPPSQRRFVFLYLGGGWDQLLFLDPRDYGFEGRDEARVNSTGIDTGYATITRDYGTELHTVPGAEPNFYFGPAAVRMTDGVPNNEINLRDLARDGVPMAMVRGINMGTLGHETGYKYFLTGEPTSGGAARGTSMPIRIASQLGERDPELAQTLLSTVALSIDSFTGNEPGRYAALRASGIDDLSLILARSGALTEAAAVEAALANYASRPLSPIARRYDRQGLLSSMIGASSSVREMLEENLAASFQFLDSVDGEGPMDPGPMIREAYGIEANLTSASARRGANVHAAFVAQAVKTGLAQFISASIRAGGDTHGAGNVVHARGQHGASDAIARLVHDLRSSDAEGLDGNWLDHTTICVFSEFSRTPLFNREGGRDHHFTNSCLLIGAGIEGGTVAGKSSDVGGMVPVPYDFGAQAPLDDMAAPSDSMRRHILPEDIGATLLASAELDHGEYRDGHPLWKLLTATPDE